MDNLLIGDVILSHVSTPSIFNHPWLWLVVKASDSNYVHAGLVYNPERSMIAESYAEGHLIRLEPDLNKKIKEGKYHIYRADINSEQRGRLKKEILKNEGSPYAFEDLFKYVLWQMVHLLKAVLPASKNRWICSEAVERLYRKINYSLLPGEKPDYITPGDLSKSKRLKRIM